MPEGKIVGVPRRSLEQFRLHLLGRLPDAARTKLQEAASVKTADNGLRELWERSDLPAGRFADEVAGFWQLPRVGLQELLGTVAMAERFSARFLRESSAFPFAGGDGSLWLAVSDPSDAAAIRAAEIVCGGALNV